VATWSYSKTQDGWNGGCTSIMLDTTFTSSTERFEHSLKNVLSHLVEYDSFMESVARVAGLGSDKEAFDMLWWADAKTRDDVPIDLNIKCTVINTIDKILPSHKNIAFQRESITKPSKTKKPYDVLWAYDVLQYVTDPYATLANWWKIATTDSMLVIAVPQTTNLEFNKQEFHVRKNHKYHYTLPMLIYMLAVNGWDCKDGFFKKEPNDPWLYAIVYRSNIKPKDPTITNLYHIAEDTDLLPDCVVRSLNKHGLLRQRDLELSWIDKNLTVMEHH
jgi:hypothetical protein